MNSNISNIKCVIFRDKDNYSLCNIIKFTCRDVAKQYYKVALRKPTFVHAEVLDECIKWCKKNKSEYNIIERSEYNIND